MCHVPAVRGDTGGIKPSSALETGFENVSVIGVVALIVAPGDGYATAVVAEPAGNQLTSAADDFSHERGRRRDVDRTGLRGARERDNGLRRGQHLAMEARRLRAGRDGRPGSANFSRNGWPEATVRKWASRCALGVISVRFSRSVLPVSHATDRGA